MSYTHRLKRLKIARLKYRRLRGDMIKVFKITIYDSHMSLKFLYHHGSISRGNKYKILNHRFYYDQRKHYFFTPQTCSAHIVNIWNRLPNHVVDITKINLFKSRLERFWVNQDVIWFHSRPDQNWR